MQADRICLQMHACRWHSTHPDRQRRNTQKHARIQMAPHSPRQAAQKHARTHRWHSAHLDRLHSVSGLPHLSTQRIVWSRSTPVWHVRRPAYVCVYMCLKEQRADGEQARLPLRALNKIFCAGTGTQA